MSGYLADPTIGLGPQAKKEEIEAFEAREKLRKLEAEARQIERALFRKCDHVFEDVTEERRALIEKRDLPSWALRLIVKGDYRWVNRRKLALEYGKCTGCGLLKISDETVGGE